jgi:hypothetical protein
MTLLMALRIMRSFSVSLIYMCGKNKTGAWNILALCLVYSPDHKIACSVEAWWWYYIITTIYYNNDISRQLEFYFLYSMLDRPAAAFRQNGFLIYLVQFLICPGRSYNFIWAQFYIHTIIHELIGYVALQFRDFKFTAMEKITSAYSFGPLYLSHTLTLYIYTRNVPL